MRKWTYNGKDFDETLIGDNWGFIYLIQFENGVFYCGKRAFRNKHAWSGWTDWKTYIGSGRIVLNYKKKHGNDWILKTCKQRLIVELCATHEIALEREQHYVARLKASGKPHWNLQDGGYGFAGFKHTDEAKQNMSNAKKGHSVSDECREKLRQANLGKTYGNEVREKKRTSMLERINAGTHKSQKLTYDDVILIKQMLTDGISLNKCAQKFNVSKKLILLIKQERNWKHVPWPSGK